MYSSLRKIAGFCIFLGFINLAAAIVCSLYFGAMPELSPSMRLAFGAFQYTTAVSFLVIGLYLWSLYSDMANHEDSNFNDLSALRRRVESLEKGKL